jgi:hypothetical protein
MHSIDFAEGVHQRLEKKDHRAALESFARAKALAAGSPAASLLAIHQHMGACTALAPEGVQDAQESLECAIRATVVELPPYLLPAVNVEVFSDRALLEHELSRTASPLSWLATPLPDGLSILHSIFMMQDPDAMDLILSRFSGSDLQSIVSSARVVARWLPAVPSDRWANHSAHCL